MIPERGIFDRIIERLPLMDIGSREKELLLTEEDLAFLGEIFLLHILSVERWQKLSLEELRCISDRMKALIQILDEHDHDSNLLRLEFDILNAFIKNFYD